MGIYDLLSYPNPPKKLTVVKYDPGDVGGNVQNMSLGCTYHNISYKVDPPGPRPMSLDV